MDQSKSKFQKSFFIIIIILIATLVSCKYSKENRPFDKCDQNYIFEDGACINEKETECQPPDSTPHNSIIIESLVTAYYTDESGWIVPECEWECAKGFFEEEGECVEDDNPYNEYSNLSDDQLILALYEKVKDHAEFTYGEARDEMYGMIDVFDGKIECIYTGRSIDGPISRNEAYRPYGINTEHSWPRGQFGKLDPAHSDLIHLFPSDEDTNSGRSSYDFGINGDIRETYCHEETCSYLKVGDDSKTVFDVRPERRGDIARAHFYMVLRYKYSSEIPIDDNSDQLGCDLDGCIRDSEEEVLRQWNIEDPVDEREIERNERIFEIQGNRNPFVDRPDFVSKISDF